jgi:hypothetical protein
VDPSEYGIRLNVDAPPGPTFIPTLDDALKDARGNEQSTLKRGDMIEIIGASGSGKYPDGPGDFSGLHMAILRHAAGCTSAYIKARLPSHCSSF